MTNLFGYDPYAEDPYQSSFSLFDDTSPSIDIPAPSLDIFGQTVDPTSRTVDYPDLFQTHEYDSPYDPNSAMRDLLKKNSTTIDGLNADRERLLSEDRTLMNSSENDWGTIGAGLVGAIGAFAAGGTGAQIAGSFADTGTSYYNNLEAQEKEKRLRVADKIKNTDAEINALLGLNRQVELGQINREASQQDDFLKGQYVGTDPYIQKRQDDLAEKTATTSSRATPLTPEQKAYYEKEFGVELNTLADVDRATRLLKETGKGERFEQTRTDQQAERQVYGLKPLKERISKDEHKEALTINAAYSEAKASINGMRDVFRENGGAPLTGPDAKTVEGYSAALYRAIRGYSGTGANLTTNEVPLVEALNVPNLDRNSVFKIVESFVRKGDFNQQLDAVESVLDKVIPARLEGYGFALDNENPKTNSGIASLSLDEKRKSDPKLDAFLRRNGR